MPKKLSPSQQKLLEELEIESSLVDEQNVWTECFPKERRTANILWKLGMIEIKDYDSSGYFWARLIPPGPKQLAA